MRADNREVHLVLALPMDYEHFARHVRTSDWLAKFNVEGTDSERAIAVQKAWEREYHPFVAAPLKQLALKARELNVRVWLNASLADFSQASHNASLVVLFSHWKGWEVLYEDAPGLSVREAVIRLAGARGALATWLQQRLPSSYNVLGTLNDALDVELSDCSNDVVDAVLESALTRRTRRRDQIDQMFAGRLRPGNSVEFMDGLHGRETFEAGIASGFNGVLDLTTCTSSVLADYLLRARPQSFRMVQFEQAQEFLYHAVCVEVALTLHLRFAVPYIEARSVADATMTEGVRSTTH